MDQETYFALCAQYNTIRAAAALLMVRARTDIFPPIEIRFKHGQLDCPLDEICWQNNRIALIGESGSGKTTSLLYFMYQIASNQSKQTKFLLPTYLPLFQIDDSDPSRMPEFLYQYHREHPPFSAFPDFPLEFYKKMIQDSNTLVILDGLDEMQRTDNFIQEVCRLFSKPGYLVASRPIADPGVSFSQYRAVPLSDAQVDDYIRRVAVIMYSRTGSDHLGMDADRSQKSFRENLKSEFHRKFATNPAMLSLMAGPAIGSNVIPSDFDTFFNELRKFAIVGWFKKCMGLGIDTKKYEGRDYHNTVLPGMALFMHEKRARDVALEEVIGLSSWEYVAGFDKELRAPLVSSWADHSKFLTWTKQDRIGFTHLGFQEALAAEELAMLKGGTRTIGEHITDPWWREVIKYFFLTKQSHKEIKEIARLIRKNNGVNGLGQEILDCHPTTGVVDEIRRLLTCS